MLKRILRHLLMLTGAMSASVVAYHLAVCFGGFEGATVQARPLTGVGLSSSTEL